jgi:hypothetical protein
MHHILKIAFLFRIDCNVFESFASFLKLLFYNKALHSFLLGKPLFFFIFNKSDYSKPLKELIKDLVVTPMKIFYKTLACPEISVVNLV